MARYIKVRPEVARYLNLQNDRLMLKDGNYILWQADMLAFGPLPRLAETLEAIGGIALMPHEAREEQDGIKLRPLPEATDPRFATPAPEEPTPEEPATPAEPEVPETPVEEEEPTGGETPGENEPPAEEESAEDTDPEPEPVPEDETTAATTEPTTTKTKKANV